MLMKKRERGKSVRNESSLLYELYKLSRSDLIDRRPKSNSFKAKFHTCDLNWCSNLIDIWFLAPFQILIGCHTCCFRLRSAADTIHIWLISFHFLLLLHMVQGCLQWVEVDLLHPLHGGVQRVGVGVTTLCMEVTTSKCVTCVWICRNVFIFKRYAQICHFRIPINFVFSLDHITLLASSGQFQKHLNLYSSWRIEAEALIVFIFLGQFRHNSQLIVAYWWCRGFQCIHDFSGTNSTASWDTIAPLYLYGTFFLWSCILCVHSCVCINEGHLKWFIDQVLALIRAHNSTSDKSK